MTTDEAIRAWSVYDGIVVRAENFGLFVETEGVPGLLRVPELSWGRINHPTDVAKVGDRVRFLVFNLNDPKQRPHEHFNGSIKILDTRLRASQECHNLGTPDAQIPLIQLSQILRDDRDYSNLLTPTIFVGDRADCPKDMPMLLREACVSEEITDAANQKAPAQMVELIPVWLAKEFLDTTKPDLTRYHNHTEDGFRQFVSANG